MMEMLEMHRGNTSICIQGRVNPTVQQSLRETGIFMPPACAGHDRSNVQNGNKVLNAVHRLALSQVTYETDLSEGSSVYFA
jgi:hypothetical protein